MTHCVEAGVGQDASEKGKISCLSRDSNCDTSVVRHIGQSFEYLRHPSSAQREMTNAHRILAQTTDRKVLLADKRLCEE